MGTRTLFRFARDCRLKASDEFSTAKACFWWERGEKELCFPQLLGCPFFWVFLRVPRRVGRGRKSGLGKLLAISGGTCKWGGREVQKKDKARIYCGIFVVCVCVCDCDCVCVCVRVMNVGVQTRVFQENQRNGNNLKATPFKSVS